MELGIRTIYIDYLYLFGKFQNPINHLLGLTSHWTMIGLDTSYINRLPTHLLNQLDFIPLRGWWNDHIIVTHQIRYWNRFIPLMGQLIPKGDSGMPREPFYPSQLLFSGESREYKRCSSGTIRFLIIKPPLLLFISMTC